MGPDGEFRSHANASHAGIQYEGNGYFGVNHLDAGRACWNPLLRDGGLVIVVVLPCRFLVRAVMAAQVHVGKATRMMMTRVLRMKMGERRLQRHGTQPSRAKNRKWPHPHQVNISLTDFGALLVDSTVLIGQ